MMQMKSKTILLAGLALPGIALAQSFAPDPNPMHIKAATYHVEPTHTRILFAVSHLGFTTWYGEFTGAGGTLSIDPAKVSAAHFDISVPVSSVSTSNTVLDNELKSPMWFDAAKYPAITFTSEKIVRTGAKTALVTGELTFHGVTHRETLKASFNASGINPISKQYTIGFDLTGTLKRSDFNQTTYEPMIGDKVTLMISAAFVNP
jgi:polyisoprenoid-binding protein YceI